MAGASGLPWRCRMVAKKSSHALAVGTKSVPLRLGLLRISWKTANAGPVCAAGQPGTMRVMRQLHALPAARCLLPSQPLHILTRVHRQRGVLAGDMVQGGLTTRRLLGLDGVAVVTGGASHACMLGSGACSGRAQGRVRARCARLRQAQPAGDPALPALRQPQMGSIV